MDPLFLPQQRNSHDPYCCKNKELCIIPRLEKLDKTPCDAFVYKKSYTGSGSSSFIKRPSSTSSSREIKRVLPQFASYNQEVEIVIFNAAIISDMIMKISPALEATHSKGYK